MNSRELTTFSQHERARQASYRCRLCCCASTPCLASGGAAVMAACEEAVAHQGLDDAVEIVATGCMGPCSRGPLVTVHTADEPSTWYEAVTPAVAKEIVDQHLAGGSVLAAHALPNQMPFLHRQQKVVLSNSGLIDPESIGDYVARQGYAALDTALHNMTPAAVCDEILRSGLRGRGGAGYPTGVKWELVRRAAGTKKYVIANGDEGDPGAYMDRALMESDPHRVLEGMAIAGYAIGADQGYIYVRGEYPIAAQRLAKAIRAAERRGLLGSRILDTNFNFRIDVRIGAGAFVCGEETALMQSIMGRRGQPVPRPPYPAQSGLWGKPTLINNVETFGSIAPIVLEGAEQFAAIGTAESKGTKIFALAGKVENTGLIEVPMGITLREIVYEIGGGIADGLAFKAAQTGGPSGGCIPAHHLDTPMDYESLRDLGSIMGSGGLIVMDEKSCMIDVAKYFMEFCADESCGKCVPCRVGTVQMARILGRIAHGEASQADLETLRELCDLVRDTSLCGLGQSAPNSVLSTVRHFAQEYQQHVDEHLCAAGVCSMPSAPRAQPVPQMAWRESR